MIEATLQEIIGDKGAARAAIPYPEIIGNHPFQDENIS
jgi:hypothetical protein